MTAQCQVFFREKNHLNIQHTKILDLAVAAKVTILKQSFFFEFILFISLRIPEILSAFCYFGMCYFGWIYQVNL